MDIEIAKLLASTLTPISLMTVGYLLNKSLVQKEPQEQEKRGQENEKLIEKRIEIYSEIANPLNKIYCYIQDAGDYKSLYPETVISSKRSSDRLFHMYRPIWSKETLHAYDHFINASFEVHDLSRNTKIKTISKNKKMVAELGKKPWLNEWNELLTEEREADYHQIYVQLMDAFAADLGYKQT